jgi:hypothetical protein
MPTPQLPGFGDASAFTRWTKSIDYRFNLLFEKLNNVLANTGLSVPGPGVTQVDGNLSVAGLGRILLATGGSIELDDKAGRQVMYVGGFTTNGFGMTLTRLNGQAALVFSDNDPVNETTQRISLQDSNGTPLFAEDKNGTGSSWPLAPVVFSGLSWPNWDSNNTSTFTTVSTALTYKASPRFVINVQHICDAGTTGEVRLTVNGTQVGSTVASAALTVNNAAFGTPAALPGNVGDAMTINVDTRTTSGTGACRARVTYCLQWASA